MHEFKKDPIVTNGQLKPVQIPCTSTQSHHVCWDDPAKQNFWFLITVLVRETKKRCKQFLGKPNCQPPMGCDVVGRQKYN